MIVGSRVGTVGPGFRGVVDVVVDPIVLRDGSAPAGAELVQATPTPAPAKADFPWGWIVVAGLAGLALGYLLFEEGAARGAQIPLG